MSKVKPAPLPPDTVIGGYRIVRKVAAGGFGVVYLAVDTEGQQVAVKEYLPSSLASRGPGELLPQVQPEKLSLYRLGLKSFFEEGRALAQISHASVVSVLNFFRENETVYMVMNYLEGSSLQEFIITARDLKKQKVFRESTIRSLYDEVLRGLRIVHQHKMLHLDIKPANIFVTDDNRAVLIDFGAAREVLSKEGNFIRPMYTPGFRRARNVPPRFEHGPLDRYLRDRRLHLRQHAGLSAQRRAAAPGKRPSVARALPLARRVFGQPDRSGGMVHVARPAVASAVGVCASKGAQSRDRAQLHQAHRGGKDAFAV